MKRLIPLAGLVWLSGVLNAQDRLKTMPGFEQYQKMSRDIPAAAPVAATGVTWKDGSIEDITGGKLYRFDVATKQTTDLGAAPDAGGGGRGRGGRGAPPPDAQGRGGQTTPDRGRQFATANSPDGALKAFYRDRNLWLSGTDDSNEKALTTDGSEKDRIKYGTASWVYGEELGQRTAIWWSPDSKKIAYYRFDESQVPDYHLQLDQTKIQSKDDVEAYPKPGVPNPVVDLFVYDVASAKTTKIDVRSGKPFDNAVLGHYVYHVAWSPDGRELLFNRWIPQENKDGYDLGSAMPYAKDLRGRLLFYYGTADNNVHPSNAMQLIKALQDAGKSFDVQVGPDRGHSGVNADRMMEFFIENLVMRSPQATPTSDANR